MSYARKNSIQDIEYSTYLYSSTLLYSHPIYILCSPGFPPDLSSFQDLDALGEHTHSFLPHMGAGNGGRGGMKGFFFKIK